MEAERGSLIGFLVMLTGDRNLADDLFQETCLEAWRTRDRFRDDGDLSSWLRGLARHVVLRHRRKAGRSRSRSFSPEVMERLEETWTRLDARRELDPRREALIRCLDEMSPEGRHRLARRYDDGQSISVLAEETGRSIGAVKMILSRLRTKLQDCVERRLRVGQEQET